MKHTNATSCDQLADALHVLGVNFIRGGKDTDVFLSSHPSRLITALAESREARLRLPLIPLFIEHPEYAPRVRTPAKRLEPSAHLTLRWYYNAAIWLAKKYQLNIFLPDHFARDLDLRTPMKTCMRRQIITRNYSFMFPYFCQG